MDRQGKTWLEAAPKIKLFPVKDARSPYPLNARGTGALFQELQDHLARMALFKVNTGLREKEVCRLKWDYEVKVPELDTSVFIIPGEQIKNGEERLVVLNRVREVGRRERARTTPGLCIRSSAQEKRAAAGDQDEQHGLEGGAGTRGGCVGERARRIGAGGFRKIRVHDLKHTFGRRLRAAGVSFEDRQDLLGHRSGRITTHYSQAYRRA